MHGQRKQGECTLNLPGPLSVCMGRESRVNALWISLVPYPYAWAEKAGWMHSESLSYPYAWAEKAGWMHSESLWSLIRMHGQRKQGECTLNLSPIRMHGQRKQGECRVNAGWMQGESRVNAGWMQGKCRVKAGWMQGDCRVNAGWMQGESRVNAGWMQGECRVNAGWMQGESRVNAGWLQGECRVNAGWKQGECRVNQGECTLWVSLPVLTLPLWALASQLDDRHVPFTLFPPFLSLHLSLYPPLSLPLLLQMCELLLFSLLLCLSFQQVHPSVLTSGDPPLSSLSLHLYLCLCLSLFPLSLRLSASFPQFPHVSSSPKFLPPPKKEPKNAHSNTIIHTNTKTRIHTIQNFSHTHTHALAHTHTCTGTHTHTHTHTHTLFLSLSHTHTHTHIHKISLAMGNCIKSPIKNLPKKVSPSLSALLNFFWICEWRASECCANLC